ncbi:MAG: hypothetical protein R3321_01580 [Nitrososphaeraceae archaeon]|nr:hypothetical protein [Nitrososphaeraceae archaeon]
MRLTYESEQIGSDIYYGNPFKYQLEFINETYRFLASKYGNDVTINNAKLDVRNNFEGETVILIMIINYVTNC